MFMYTQKRHVNSLHYYNKNIKAVIEGINDLVNYHGTFMKMRRN